MTNPSLRMMLALLAVSFAVTACAPEIGSPRWCEALKAKAPGDLSANELADFTRHCIFK